MQKAIGAVGGAVTALLLAISLASIVIWTRNIGLAEDWNMVAAMTGHQHDLGTWIWAQNNEHRLPVQRIIYLGLLRATGDFRSAMVFSQLLMACLALVLMRAAFLARGRQARLSDAVFPLALMHLGHWENLLWGWQIQFTWSVFLCGLLLAVILRQRGGVFLKAGLLTVVLLVLLPLAGANGIIVALGLLPWAVLSGIGQMRAGQSPAARRGGMALLIGAGLGILSTLVYFIGYQSPQWSPPLATPRQFLHAALAYFAMAFGPWARAVPWPAGIGMLLFSTAGAMLALRHWIRVRATDGPRALGLALFIAVNLALGVAISLARGSYPSQMPDRYALFSVLPLLGAVMAWDLYGPRRAARAIVAGAALIFLLALPLNIKAGFKWRYWYEDGMQAVEADIATRTPLKVIARRHRQFLLHWNQAMLEDGMTQLHDASVGPFATVPKQ